SFFFDDDTFNLGRERCLRFADEMDRRQLRMPWGMNARADNWDRELMKRLVATGLFTIRVGVESGDPEVLARTQKGITLEQVRTTLEMAHSLGVRNHVSFVIGLPGETDRTVDNTIRFIKSVPVDSVQFSVAIPFPGTSLFREVESRGHLATRDWPKFNGFDHVVVRTDEMRPEAIRRAVDRARRAVYMSPRFIVRRLSYVRDFRDLRALTRKAFRLMAPWARRGREPAAAGGERWVR
ncbi:MAG TPA: radical SAM protein, partial [Gemmataceae bacterium]|nr:radical SAM protein [Gemmataceae bacterium]